MNELDLKTILKLQDQKFDILITEVKELRKEIKIHNTDLTNLKINQAVLQVKNGLWGTIGGALVLLLARILKFGGAS